MDSRILKIITIAIGSFTLAPQTAFSQSTTITSPVTAVTVSEGIDFATHELQDPWDFAERRDFAWEENFTPSSITTAGGIWSAVNQNGRDTPTMPSSSGFVMPLFAGPLGAAAVEGLPGDRSLPKSGLKRPIDTSRYTMMSIRMRHGSPSDMVLNWKSDPNPTSFFPSPSDPLATTITGYHHGGFDYFDNNWAIYTFDLTSLATEFDSHQGTWSGFPYSLRIEPSVSSTSGALASFDWVRLVDPSSSAPTPITWTAPALSSADVLTIFVDDDASGYDGTPVKRFTDGIDPGSYNFPTASLPPGTYYFYIEIYTATSGFVTGPYDQSGYSAPVTITAAPSGFFTAPSPVSGPDYATTAQGDSWEMSALTDVANVTQPQYPAPMRQLSNSTVVTTNQSDWGGRVFRATTALPNPPAPDDAVLVMLNTASRNPIDPTRYRYLTVRMRANDTAVRSLQDKLQAGWNWTVGYFNHASGDLDNKSGEQFLYEDWHTYTVDLWDPLYQEGNPWLGTYRWGNFYISPLDTPAATQFRIDWVKLIEENQTFNNQFTIALDVSDADSSNLTIDLFYDTDDIGFDGTQFGTLSNVPPGAYNANFNAASLPAGTYHVYAEVTDGSATNKFYATTPISHNFLNGGLKKAPLDFDGDGRSDQAVYRKPLGKFFQNWSSFTSVSVQWVAGSQYEQLQGDFDGDGIEDLSVVFPYEGFIGWYIAHSSTNSVHSFGWGYENDRLAVADYNGNGRDEVAVFRDGLWFIIDEAGGVHTDAWGVPGDIPVPADYDGDGADDIAVWRPSNGTWYIINSGYPGVTTQQVTVRQFGLDGDMPLPADWFGNDRDEIAVYRNSTQQWFILNQDDNFIEFTQWGLPNDQPIVGDFNADGLADLTVYRPSSGDWFHNFRNFHAHAVQYGLPGDGLPVK